MAFAYGSFSKFQIDRNHVHIADSIIDMNWFKIKSRVDKNWEKLAKNNDEK